MGFRGTLALATVATLLPICAARSLERAPSRADDPDDEAWSSTAACTIQYYNTCTGWIFAYEMNDVVNKVGVLIDGCGPDAVLQQTMLHIEFPGYAFWSMLSVHEVDESGTPQFPALAQQPPAFCCWEGPDWWTSDWGIPVPDRFMVLYQSHVFDQAFIYMERPLAGPSGPAACGYCYPTTRVIRTFVWPAGDVTGPGEPFDTTGSPCGQELLLRCSLSVATSVDETSDAMSWGGVKALYR